MLYGKPLIVLVFPNLFKVLFAPGDHIGNAHPNIAFSDILIFAGANIQEEISASGLALVRHVIAVITGDDTVRVGVKAVNDPVNNFLPFQLRAERDILHALPNLLDNPHSLAAAAILELNITLQLRNPVADIADLG